MTIHTLVASDQSQDLKLEPLLVELIGDNSEITESPEDIAKFETEFKKAYPYLRVDPDALPQDERLLGDALKSIKRSKLVMSGLDDLRKIKAAFEAAGFHKVRHQTVAHKNPALRYPDGSIDMLVIPELLEKLCDVIKELRIQAYFWFEYAPENPQAEQVLSQLDGLIKCADASPAKTFQL